MYCLTAFIVLLFCAFPARSQHEIVVIVEGLKNSKGTVMVGLFDNDDDFLERPVRGEVAAINSRAATVVFRGLRPGRYALSVIHDENSNGKLDRNALGIPKEGFAFGNNAMGLFGPPSFEKASVIFDNRAIRQTLKMRYF